MTDVAVSPSTREAARVAALQFNDFLARFQPIQDRLVSIARDKSGFIRRQIGAANAQAVTSAGLTPSAAAATLRTGSPTGNVHATGDVADRASQIRRGLGAAYGVVVPAAQERETRTELKVGAIGRGLNDAALLSTADLGRTATALEIERNSRDLAERRGLLDALFTAGGAYAATQGVFG